MTAPARADNLGRALWSSFLRLYALWVALSGCAPPLSGGGRWSQGGRFSRTLRSDAPVPYTGAVLEAPAVTLGAGVQGAEDEPEARRAEMRRAQAQLWGIASGVDEVGALLRLTYWAERGTLTLVDYRAEPGGGRSGRPATQENLEQALAPVFNTYIRQHVGLVRVVLRREEGAWALGTYDTGLGSSRPPEARQLPVYTEGVPLITFQGVQEAASKLTRLLTVPAGGQARQVVEVRLEDGRVVGWDERQYEVLREGGAKRPLEPSASGVLSSVLMPFTEAIGARTIRLEWVASHETSHRGAQVWVRTAQVLRPPLPASMDEDFAAAYRAMHEDTLRRWREDVADGTAWVLKRGVEEAALWYVGGMLTRGVGLLAELSAPVLEAVLARGGRIAAGWLRSAMVRLPLKDRKAFERLWAKVMLEGEAALTTAERDMLRGLMQRLDRLVRNPLSEGQKDNLRDAARQVYKQNHPHLKALLEAQPRAYHVHHRRPLEYAHLFADDDINSPQNLALVSEVIHQRIGALWTKIRVARPGATAEEIAEAARRIDDRFLPWYHQASAPPGLSLAQAEEAALQSLKQLFPGLS